MTRTYLGDSVWAERQGQYIALTVGRQDGEPDVYLDDRAIQGLAAVYEKHRPLNQPEQ
jgi:hypothetical protein